MLLENGPFPQDIRVLNEAQTLVAAGYRVSLICPAKSDQYWREKINGVNVFRYPPSPRFNSVFGYLVEYGYSMLATFLLSLLVCVKPGFDIIHAANPPDTMVFCAAFYKLFKKRFIYDHHDLAPELFNARFINNKHNFLYRILVLLEKISCQVADLIITTSQSYKVLEIERARVPAERIVVVRNGPDNQFQYIKPEPGLCRPDKTIIAYAGTIGVQDGVDYLLRALKHLSSELGRKDFICYLVGDGDAFDAIKVLTEKLELRNLIYFTGWIDHPKVARYLSMADICVAPEPSNSYNDRSTIIKIMEYMAMGKPIVSFDLPENRVSAQDAALYARPNDTSDFAQKISTLMDDSERRIKMGRYGRERIEKELAWRHQKKYLIKAYEKISNK